MTYADRVFKDQIRNIIMENVTDKDLDVRPVWNNGEKAYTKYTTHQIATINPERGVPIQTVRKIAWKSALREILAIYQKHATTREEFEAMGIKWWELWFNEKGNLGTSYSHQLKKKLRYPEGEFTQFDYIIHQLKNNPMNRGMITNIFNMEEIADMALRPCAFLTMWAVRGEYLDLMLVQRSGDLIPAAGFGGVNTIQYYFLLAMVAQVTGYKIGKFTHVINNLHIYDRHIPIAKDLLNAQEYESPTLCINPDVKDFYDFTVDDIRLIDYKFDKDIKNIPIAI